MYSIDMQLLKDLKHRFELYGVCVPCGRMQRLDMATLIEHLGEDADTDAVRQRVRCQSCGERRRDIRIVYAGTCGSAARFEYR
ncbi:MAG: hypothetical protein NXH85_04895 [Pseudomonadaceae bacterium]|nr:hypothetical protein [Pseudomonadaceae bacterium]